ncbi:MAG: hypothetical protein Q9197_004120 [Variospora fuerteventurae]
MHHYHFFLFSFFLTFAIPSFAAPSTAPVPYNRDHFLKNPKSVEGGKITLSFKNSKSGEDYPFDIPFNHLATPEKARHASRIAVVAVEGLNGINTADVKVTLEAKDILCQCFIDKTGKYTLGIPFGLAPEKGGPRYSIPNAQQPVLSIICMDAKSLHAYIRSLPVVPAIPRRSI